MEQVGRVIGRKNAEIGKALVFGHGEQKFGLFLGEDAEKQLFSFVAVQTPEEGLAVRLGNGRPMGDNLIEWGGFAGVHNLFRMP